MSAPCDYVTTAGMGVSNASQRGTKSEMARHWRGLLKKPYGPWCGCKTLRGGRQNQRWPTNGPGGYVTLAALGGPNVQRRRQNLRVLH